MSNIPAPGSRE